jgi:hypothetical protein
MSAVRTLTLVIDPIRVSIRYLQGLRSERKLKQLQRQACGEAQQQQLDFLKKLLFDISQGQWSNLLYPADATEQIVNDVANLRKALETAIEASERTMAGSFMSELTDEEKREIFQAMTFNVDVENGATRWMNCPNGHMYVVGNCGQFNQVGRCPDCGARIGDGGSREATEFVRQVLPQP